MKKFKRYLNTLGDEVIAVQLVEDVYVEIRGGPFTMEVHEWLTIDPLGMVTVMPDSFFRQHHREVDAASIPRQS